MSHAGRRSQPYDRGVLGYGPVPCFFFLLSASPSLERGGMHRRLPPCISRRNSVNRLGTWNIRGINKREEVGNIFRKGKFELLALTEAKL